MKSQIVIAREAGLSFGGLVFGQVLRFLINLAIAALFGVRYLGTYALALAVIQIVEVCAVSGLDIGVLRYINMSGGSADKQRECIGSALKTSLLYALPFMLLLIVVSGPLSALFNGGSLLSLALVCYSLSVPFNVLTTVAAHSIQAYKNLRPKILAMQIIFPATALLVLLLFDATAGHTVALMAAPPLAASIAFGWIWKQLGALTGTTLRDVLHAGSHRDMLNYSRPMMFVALLSIASHWLDILMLGMYTGVDTVGIYQPAVRTAGLMRSVLVAFTGIAAPFFAEMHGRGEREDLQRTFKLLTRWVILVSLPFAVYLMVMPETFLALFGEAFIAAGPVLAVLAMALFVQSVFGLHDVLLQMTGFSKVCFINGAAGVILHVLLNMIFITHFGMIGAAWALLILYVLLGVVRTVEVGVLLRFHAFSFTVCKPVAAALVTAAALVSVKPFLDSLHVLVSFAGGGILIAAVYLLCIRVLQLEQEELDVILEMFNRSGTDRHSRKAR